MNNWKQDFEKEFEGHYSGDVKKIKAFIQSLLDKQREELREWAEGMKQKPYPKDDRSDAQIEHELVMVTAYNQALDDLLTKLEEE